MTKGFSIKTVVRLGSLLLLGFAVPCKALAASKPESCTTIDVTSTISDVVPDAANSTPTPPAQVQSDTKGAYTTSSTAGVNSWLGGVGCAGEQWYLDTSNSITRSLRLTLADPLSGSLPFAGGGTLNLNAKVFGRCYENTANNGATFSNMSPGEVLGCSLATAFNFDGNSYMLKMNPSNSPESTWVQAQCTGGPSGACNQWTLTTPEVINGTGGPYYLPEDPSTGQYSAVANLYQALNGGKLKLVGQYYVALYVTITNP